MPTQLSSIRRAFHALRRAKQNHFLNEIYGYSQEMRQFLDSRLLNAVDGKALINAMEKETLEKVFHRPIPRTPDGRRVRSIIARAKKLGVDDGTILDLERMAFEGFVEFLNEYGGGPESFDEMACSHLEAYLRLMKKIHVDVKRYAEGIDDVRKYLRKKHNMITDFVYEVFEKETGTPV